ncbi:DUF3196 family protein [Mesoplasma photuris]|uniref:DUF3196 family protein n=1 Tax=Mesoplasma photuris TaxID=217731 RepID=UPI0004E1EF3D|nr:DUF3196 family protein [Mesoplasma photuris]
MNYYDEIILEIKNLIETKDYQQAMEIIDLELKIPYVPADSELELLKLKREILDIQVDTYKNSGAKAFSIEEIQAMLKNFKDPIEQMIAIQNLSTINIRNIILDVEKFLIDENNSPESKTFMLMNLNAQELDKEFKVIKHKEFLINPINIDMEKIENTMQEVKNLLSNTLGQDNPSFFEMCNEVLFTYFLITYPEFEIDNINNFAAALTKIVYDASGVDISDDELNKWFLIDDAQIENIIKRIRESGAI